jgi:hypothetical protein
VQWHSVVYRIDAGVHCACDFSGTWRCDWCEHTVRLPPPHTEIYARYYAIFINRCLGSGEGPD